MAIVFALSAALAYGSADFVGGVAARRAPAVAVALASQLTGLAVLVVAVPLLDPVAPSARQLLWGAVAGAVGGLGLMTLLRALARGPMSIVAPTTALTASLVPIAVGLLLGERPRPMALVGIAVSLLAVLLITREPAGGVGGAAAAGVLGLAVGGGVLFGLFFVGLHQAGPGAGLWPLVAARCASVPLLGVLARRQGVDVRPSSLFAAPSVAASGGLDMAANILYLLALGHGMLAVVAALTGLYPATTVALAQSRLRERLDAPQVAGMATAAVAAVLIAVA